MEPRISKDKKWTTLPKEYLEQVQEVCQESFKAQAKMGTFLAEGRIYPSELVFRLGYWEKGRLAQVNFEISIIYHPVKENVKNLLALALDTTASWMEGYFENEEESEEYPRDWTRHNMGGKEVYLKYSTVNSKLESEADKLLGDTKESLVVDNELDDEEDRLAVNQMLGLTGDEDPDDDSEGGGSTTH